MSRTGRSHRSHVEDTIGPTKKTGNRNENNREHDKSQFASCQREVSNLGKLLITSVDMPLAYIVIVVGEVVVVVVAAVVAAVVAVVVVVVGVAAVAAVAVVVVVVVVVVAVEVAEAEVAAAAAAPDLVHPGYSIDVLLHVGIGRNRPGLMNCRASLQISANYATPTALIP